MHKPAPIMATWLGYLASIGLSVMDFRLVDAITDPIGWTENQHIESLIRMEGAQWCYQIQEGTPTIQMPTPFEKNGFITFGSFNQCDKLSEECLSGWADILKVVTNSQLMFMAVGDGMAKQRIIHIMQNQGIDASRLKFEPRKNWQAYFESYNAVDIALDSYPYSGATTACDSLVMGVPVLTLVGERSISRSVASILSQVNYEHWIAHNKAELSHIAKKCAEDIAEGAYPKADIRQKFTQSNLTHAKNNKKPLLSGF